MGGSQSAALRRTRRSHFQIRRSQRYIFKFADLSELSARFGRFRPSYCHVARVVRVVRVKIASRLGHCARPRAHPTPLRLEKPRSSVREAVREAAGVFGPKYRATRAPHGSRSFYAVVGRARAICAYPGRSVGRSGRRTSPVGRCS